MIRTIIIDDEPLARNRIQHLLAKYPNINVLQECKNGNEAIAAIRNHHPDLVFLDIQMTGKTGFDVLQAIPASERPLTIFTTAFDQYAIQAFDYFAFDYLLKPFKDERFYQSLQKAIQTIEDQKMLVHKENLKAILEYIKTKPPQTAETINREFSQNRIPVKVGDRVCFIPVDNILYLLAAGNYVEVISTEKKYLLRESLAELEEKLDNTHFVRIHRSSIINLRYMEAIQNVGNGSLEVKMQDQKVLKVSRSYRKQLLRLSGIRE